jgi:hypothetical protein
MLRFRVGASRSGNTFAMNYSPYLSVVSGSQHGWLASRSLLRTHPARYPSNSPCPGYPASCLGYRGLATRVLLSFPTATVVRALVHGSSADAALQDISMFFQTPCMDLRWHARLYSSWSRSPPSRPSLHPAQLTTARADSATACLDEGADQTDGSARRSLVKHTFVRVRHQHAVLTLLPRCCW